MKTFFCVQDFEVHRIQRQITAAEERMELRDAVKKRNVDELQKLKAQKRELEGEMEILHQQNLNISRSLTLDMRLLEDNSKDGALLARKSRRALMSTRVSSRKPTGTRRRLRRCKSGMSSWRTRPCGRPGISWVMRRKWRRIKTTWTIYMTSLDGRVGWPVASRNERMLFIE